jgi:iduronate 2-sulfatase
MVMFKRFLLLISIWGGLAVGDCFAQQLQRSNILLIMVDDLRPELGCYGSSRVKSPNIDKLASESNLFKNAYCNSAVCGPSRASLLTGVRPIPNKRFKNWNARADEEAKGIVSLPEHLKNNGYYTISNGKVMHHQDDSPQAWSEPSWRSGNNRGASFHVYNDNNDWLNPASANLAKDHKGPYLEAAEVSDSAYHDGEITNKTIADLRRMAESKQPFFIASGFWRPHLPFNAPKKYWDLYNVAKIPLATNRFPIKNAPDFLQSSREIFGQYTANEGFPDDTAFHQKSIHGYLASVSYIDAQIGRIIDELKTLGLYQNTIVVLLGDHGFHLGEHNFWGKHNTMNVSVNAPLIIRHPTKKAAILPQNVEFVDIYPTICHLTNLPIPTHCVGKSVNTILGKSYKKHKEFIFTGHENAISVKHDNLLYTEWGTGESSMLFDHTIDPNENTNVSNDRKYQKRKNQLHQELEALRSSWHK